MCENCNTKHLCTLFSDSPKLLKTSGSLKFFSGLYQNVTLHLTVRAFPEFTDVQSAFMWYFVNNSIRLSSAEIKSTKLGPEVFQSVLNINYVGVKDYGVFIVTTNNGIGAPVKFSIILEEKGIYSLHIFSLKTLYHLL